MITRKRIYKLRPELPNYFRKLENFKKITEILGFEGEYSASEPKSNFDVFGKKSQKISRKTFHRKTFFVNLSTTSFPRFYYALDFN